MASADRRPDTVRAALTAAGRAVYGALLGVRDAAVRFLRWVARWWRASLQFRVVTTTILLSLVMMQFSKEYIARLDPVPPANRAAQVQRSWDLFRDPTNRLQT